jgi:hypothetical protein
LLNEFAIGPEALSAQIVAGTPENDEPGHGIVRRTGHVQGVAAVPGRLRYPGVRWVARGR